MKKKPKQSSCLIRNLFKPKRIMGSFFTFILFSTLQVNALSIQPNINLNVKNASLESVIWQLKKQTGFTFLYSSNDIKDIQDIDLNVKNEKLENVLNYCLKKNGLGYIMNENTIIIKKPKAIDISTEQTDIEIKGKVTDVNGFPLPGATIIIVGTLQGTTTNENGDFTLTVSPTAQLKFSYVGYIDQLVDVDNKTIINIILQESETSLEEVIITGYFEKDKTSYTGTAVTFSGEELKQISTQNILSAVSIIDPSFKLIENIDVGSDPNNIPQFTIRGQKNLATEFQNDPNMPTFILDGFEVSAQNIFDLDPSRVKSFTILKDASATAIYGSRAANGVVVVETIAPKMGKLSVTYNLTSDIEIADLSDYNLMNAEEKLEFEKLAGLYRFDAFNVGVQENGRDRYNEILKLVRQGVNTDWMPQVVKDIGLSMRHSLLLEGGDEKLRYGVNLYNNNKSGVMKGSGRDVLGIGIKLLYRYKNLKFVNDLTYDHVKEAYSPYGMFNEYTFLNPYFYPYDENGNIVKVMYEYQNGSSGLVTNPMYNATNGTRSENNITSFRNNFSLEWDILKGLKFRTQASINKKNYSFDDFKPGDHTSFINSTIKGKYTKSVEDEFTYDISSMIQYNTSIDKHLITFMGVHNIQQRTKDRITSSVYNFPNSNMDHFSMGLEYLDGDKPSGFYNKTRLIGLTGNLNYSYDKRFFVDASVRSDASSIFGSDKRWGTFGSLGAGWNIHNENFGKNLGFVNNLKLRGSWGTTGGQNFFPYQAMMRYQYNDDLINGLTYDGYIGSILKAFGNPNLKWQVTEKLNFGVDFALFDNRLAGYFNIYKDISKDVLIDVTLAPSIGFNNYKDNLGEVQNSGIELNLRGTVIKNGSSDLQWDVFASIVKNRNKLLNINDALIAYNEQQDELTTTKPVVRYMEGASINTIWANKSLGIDPSTGLELFLDHDGNKTSTWNTANYKPLGNADPDFEGNFGTMLFYKRFRLNAYFSYSYGGDIYNSTLVNKVENINPLMNADRRALYNRWSEPGDISEFKSITSTSITFPTSRFIEEQNYISLSSLNVSYQFNQQKIKKIGFNNLKVSMIGNNIFRWSTVKQERGILYPYARTYSLALSLTF